MNNTWKVILIKEAKDELTSAPGNIKKKFDYWVFTVQAFGPWLKGGFRTEALSGILKGFYSARLDKKWRVIFEVNSKRSVIVIRIVAHDYKSVSRRY